jgi:replicative DNA helicase
MPGGIDLRRPHDQHMVDRAIRETGAQFVALGPMYKSFLEGGEKAETVNGQVARILDRYRERYGITLWLETHAPMEQNGQRSLRPLGSGVWTRWPEFGLALRKNSKNPMRVDVGRFRGDRDERAWPHHLERSSPWPWAPIWDGGYPIEEAASA